MRTGTHLAAQVHAQALRTPDALALKDGDRTFDYATLDALGAAVAEALTREGVRRGDAVAVGLARSWELVCVMLGILRLGGKVVPLDRLSPADRRAHILTDSASVALIHHGMDDVPSGVRSLVMSELFGEPPPEPGEPATPVGASFLFYTSGTTGSPKGVEVPDAGILRLAEPGYIEIEAGMRYACLSNPAFDALSFEVWVPLLTGGCCVILDDETAQTPHELAAALVRERVDTIFLTTALFNAVVDAVPDCFASARQVLVGGEQLNAGLMRRWYRDNPDAVTRLHNVYGPTETTTFALCHRIPRDFDGDPVPIGRPLARTGAVLVVPGAERVARPGELAELYLAGAGLAAGYRNLPEETERRFVRLPWHDDARYYRTGDLVRADAEGRVEYVGRADRQVKVRGFRIEPGELERQILRHPAVRQAFVCTRRAVEHGPNELLAYVVAGELSFGDFDRHLVESLPSYMRPHHVYRVDALPLNANGKVDQALLLGSDVQPWRREDAARPVTAWQREVLELAAEVLGVAEVRLDDRWIACGGDSLKALRFRFAARQRWGCELAQSVVLQGDFAELAAAIKRAGASDYPVPVHTDAVSGPATSEQQRLWLLQQRTPGSRAYNVGFAFRIDGEVDADRLRRSLRRLVEIHPALRTGFEATPEGLRQVVGEPYDPWVEPEPDFFAKVFDVARPRLFDACWRADDRGGVLLLRTHHIAVDGWSISILLRDLSAAYPEAPEFTTLDHAAWQAEWFQRPAYLKQREELRAHYAGLDLAAEPVRPFSSAGLLHRSLDVTRRAKVDRLCAELGLTRFQLLLGVFAWSLYGVTGQTGPRIASPVANRPVQEFDGTVGMFANTVALPVTVAPREDARAQLRRLGESTQKVLDRQDVALADVVEGQPFDFLFVLENTEFDAFTLPGTTIRPLWEAPAEAKCSLTMSVLEQADGFDCLWEYAEDHFTADQVAAMAELFGQALDRLASGPSTPAELAAGYRRGLPEHGRGEPAPLTYSTIAEGFARRVALTPDAPALLAEDGSVSYAELDAASSALAADLRERYDVPDEEPCHVALFFEPSAEHVVALLALAKLNLTAVPLDPAYPPVLLRQIVDQVAPLCVLLAPGGEAQFRAVHSGEVALHPVTMSAAASVHPSHSGKRPLYTLFTSGSTGTPKGVQVPDRALCNLLQWQAESGGLADPARTQQFSMLSFDVSFQEIFGTLCGGGCLRLIRPEWRHDIPALLDRLDAAERIFLPYVALQLLAEHGVRLGRYPARLREVITAGEQLVCTDAIRRWFAGMPGARLFNHYGPTETHVVSALCLDGDPALWPERPAIGRPVANAVLRVVDEADEIVPPGCEGNLLIGGLMASRCYLDADPDRFAELPELFYRTGDRAYFDHNGLLHFAGRDDQQIKLSGYRLELGQVEAALLRHPEIVNAVVVRDGDALVACLHCRETPSAESLTAHLADLLPAYVRIDRFRLLTALPRTPSGKLDRAAALDAPGRELGRVTAAKAGSAVEARLTELFEAAAGVPIGLDETFFDAGASSLGLMRFHLRCTAEPDFEFTVADLFEHVTIRALARFLGGQTPESGHVGSVMTDEPIAVVGMAVRLPGASDLAAFWEMVRTAGTGIEHFDAEDGLVGARSQMDGLLAFDPGHFGISARDAALMDPQQRHLLMCCVQALAHAGITDSTSRRVGLVAGCGENTYFQSILREADPARLPDVFQLAQHHDKDFLATKAAYHLGLTGPAFTTQAACGTSLVAVHVAAGLLRHGDAEVMLAGGVLVDPSLTGGYRYRPQHIFSEDGRCRPFSDDSSGTIGASGVGVVVLKPLRLAREDGDTVYSVITGSALNNDGSAKLGYSAPSLAGQREVIRTALRRSGRSGSEIGYVEAHGTATRLGDPVEVGALRQALEVTEPGRIALSSVKSQIGHLGAAAGVIGLIRATLSVHHGLIPPTVGFRAPNPELAADLEPFYVPTEARPWPAGDRVAAVSSFGIGGTNAHVVLEAGEAAPMPETASELVLSSSSEAALRADAAAIADYLTARPEAYPQVVRHLRSGRPARRWRMAATCADAAAAVAWLRTAVATEVEPVDRVLERPAQAPWDFPPPAFDLADYDFDRLPKTVGPRRLPETDWLHQPHWVRLRRATTGASHSDRVLVLMSDLPLDTSAFPHERVVRVTPAEAFARRGDDRFEVDPADPASLKLLFDALGEHHGIDWLHALPLGIDGLERARWACLDTPAALLRAGVKNLRTWWLSSRARPVDGAVERPEAGLLAGITMVGPAETGVPGHWVDLPGTDLSALADLLTGPTPPSQVALRRGFWWERTTTPVSTVDAVPVVGDGVHLILGGTGGIGTAIAEWLLESTQGRVLLLARRPELPEALRPWADRVELIAADLAGPVDLSARIDRLDSVIHAAGEAAGGPIATRDADSAHVAKLRGALVTEELIARYRPALAVYCSSMSAHFGGAGQLDYAAANGLLDAFAHQDSEATTRIAIDWDIWNETGMAVQALRTDARHQAHLAVGMTVAEGKRLFARALALGLPQLLVSTTPLDEAETFYGPTTPKTADTTAEALSAELCEALGLDELDPDAPLYDLGADSLTMLDLIDTVKRLSGVDLDLARFSHQVSLAEVLARLAEGEADAHDVTLEIWQEGTGREVLCLVHPVGGDIQAYGSLVSALDPRLTVCLIADPGLRQARASTWTLTERARRYYAALHARFPGAECQLAGWSFGAWVATGMAAEAETAGRPARALHLLDPPPPGADFGGYDETRLEAVFARELGDAADSTKAYAERLARCCRANLRSMAGHELPKLAATPSGLWLAERPVPELPSVAGQEALWQPHLPEPTDWHRLDTNHYGIVRAPHVHAIAAVINATIGEAR
ncbi:amino acid adenylation domain-containing protein [Amycolatopsis xylanica]|uniref:Amino acid adenylation domain-containing protein n=1 Tax=Amycolatopsis xylanica TaxID=589385 RepID=A0A1H3RP63_9PSEU|nr:non-ribosomal peptide synthetase [Amycolatopsis xylanica]SDZ27512.1 amino acid adenylation domain-containing protein [Amycolatopsis xylanica]